MPSRDGSLVINAGNNFDPEANNQELTIEYMIKALSLSGVEIIGIGPGDLCYGIQRLQKLVRDHTISMVSANIEGFAQYARFTKNGGKADVMVTAVIDPLLMSESQQSEGEVSDPVVSLRHLISQKAENELLVAIVHAKEGRVDSIADACPGIDLVIDAYSTSLSKRHSPRNHIPIVANNLQGTYVSYLEYFGDRKNDVIFSTPVNIRAGVDEVEEDSKIKQLIKEYEIHSKNYYKYIEKKADLAVSYPCQEKRYLGSHVCNTCHPSISEQWQKSDHAMAFNSLEKKSKAHDPDCQTCHVTGVQDLHEIGCWMTFEDKAKMAGVQCEACHGPGRDHIQNPEKQLMRPISSASCIKCHTRERDPGFDFHRDYTIVYHGREKIDSNSSANKRLLDS